MDGYENKVPTTPEEFAEYFLASPYHEKLRNDIEAYKASHFVPVFYRTCPWPALTPSLYDLQADHSDGKDADMFRNGVKSAKHFGVGRKSAFRVNLFQQIGILCKRQIRLTWADKPSFLAQIASNVLQAVLVGAVCEFYSSILAEILRYSRS